MGFELNTRDTLCDRPICKGSVSLTKIEMEICKQQSEIEVRQLPAILIYRYVGGRQI